MATDKGSLDGLLQSCAEARPLGKQHCQRGPRKALAIHPTHVQRNHVITFSRHSQTKIDYTKHWSNS